MTFYDLRTVRGVPAWDTCGLRCGAAAREAPAAQHDAISPRDDYARALNARQERGVQGARTPARRWNGARRRPWATWGRRFAAWTASRETRSAGPAPRADINRGGWSKGLGEDHRFDLFEIFHLVEQAPHRDNRVYLSDKVDRDSAAGRSRRLALARRGHREDHARAGSSTPRRCRAPGSAGSRSCDPRGVAAVLSRRRRTTWA